MLYGSNAHQHDGGSGEAMRARDGRGVSRGGEVTVLAHRRGTLAVVLLAVAGLHYIPVAASYPQANLSASEQLAPSAWRPDACQLPALRYDGPPRGADQSQAWEQRIRDVFPVFSRYESTELRLEG